MSPLPAELVVLGLSVLLLVAQILTQAHLVTKERGLAYNAGPRDGAQEPLGTYAGRAQRALDNFKETYPAFVGLALALAVVGATGGLGAVGAWLWLIARIVYLPLYLFGVPYIRSAAFGASMLGLALMLIRLFF